MVRMIGTLAALAISTALAACGAPDGEQSDKMDAAETPTARGPYADAEKRMHDAMMTAVGTDVGDSWAKKMVAHHQGAIDMSEIVLQENPSSQVAEMARMTIEKQGQENETIRRLFKDGAPDQQSADLYRTAMMDMHTKMQAATGADASETYLRKMLEHHRGAVSMSDLALQNGVSGPLRAQVQKTRDDQQKEIEMVVAMLSGETMDHSAHTATAAAAPPVAAPKAAASARARSKPAATPTRAAPTVQPSPSATSSCTPEHRELGHC
jgi:uncharacterized protein (DUF305 family)